MQERVHSLAEPIYTEEELKKLNSHAIPHHIAIIMDGNRRWARENHCPLAAGHWRGAERLDPIIQAAVAVGIRVLTVYAFSTENWSRSDGEVALLMKLFENYLVNKRAQLVKEGVRVHAIGDLTKVPFAAKSALEDTIVATQNGETIDLVLAVNYGGRDEICRGIKKILLAVERGEMDIEDVTEEKIACALDTAPWPDPDLLIRTSGEQRISNFLPWQTTYSEIVIVPTMWPDFSAADLLEAIFAYQLRQRRFGE